MDKYEYNIKAEQIVKLIDKKDFLTAAKIADGIDWRRVRNVNMLTNVGTVYAEAKRYEDAKEILMIAFSRAPVGRRLAYKLTEVCIEAGEFDEAETYYRDFLELAPRDSGKFELLYKLAVKKGDSVEKKIQILEEYKRNDYEEAWAYELARLYHKAGMAQECISECDEIILWFGEGAYVEKAMELKMLYTPLSPSQQEKYNRRFHPEMRYTPQMEQPEVPYDGQEAGEPAIPGDNESQNVPEEPVSVSMDMYNTANIQAALAESMKEIMDNGEAELQPEGEPEPERPNNVIQMTRDIRREQRALNRKNVTCQGLEDEKPQTEGEPDEAEVLSLYHMKEQAGRGAEESRRPEEYMPEHAEEASSQTGTAVPEETYARQEEQEEAAPEENNLMGALDQVIDEITSNNIPKSAMGRKLSEERKKIFANFIHMTDLEEQLAEVFDEAARTGEEKDTSLFGNIIVVGEHKTGKTTLAVQLMKELNKANNRRGRKIAKISGDRLNNKGIQDSISRLIGADLLIERAGDMNKSTVKELIQAMAGYTGGMLVVLEDTRENMESLTAENPEIEVRFTHKIILKECDIAEWVEIAKKYASEQDYGIDEMASLALSAKIDAIYAQKSVIDMADIKTVIDAAIEKSEKKNIKKLFDTVFSRKYRDSDLTMLRESDFS